MAQIVNLSARITAKQRDVLLLMAQGESYRAISETTGVALQTLYNWRSANTAFRRELVRLQEHLYAEGIRGLRGLLHEATSTLRAVMTDSSTRDADRIAAARTVLQFAVAVEPEARSDDIGDEFDFSDLAEQIVEIVRSRNAS